MSFYTSTTSSTFGYPDRIEVRLCTVSPCTDVGTSATDVGDFGTLLLSINPSLSVGGYLATWTQFLISTGMPSSGSGRIAFRYFATDTGPDGHNPNYIGIDRVVINNGSDGIFCSGFEDGEDGSCNTDDTALGLKSAGNTGPVKS